MNGAVSFETLIERLKNRLEEDLPGQKAQMKMAPVHRFDFPEHPEQAKLSSVLILLYPYKDSVFTSLIKRASYNGHHSGQISFPGGKFETNDETLIYTALREANEEVGITFDEVRILGTISSLYIPVSNIMVLPVIGYANERPEFSIDPIEVDHLLEVDINDLLKPEIIKSGFIKTHRTEIKAPYFDIEDNVVWGATAMIISEFIEVLEKN